MLASGRIPLTLSALRYIVTGVLKPAIQTSGSRVLPQAGSSAPEPGRRAEGKICSTTTDCIGTDINMVCRSAKDELVLFLACLPQCSAVF